MKTKSNFSKIPLLLSIALFLLSCSAFLFFYQAINNKKERAESKEAEWQKETARRDEIKALDYSIKAIELERVQLETHFAQSSDVVPFLDTIEELAPKVGIQAEVTSVNLVEDKTSLVVGMKASGSFEGLYKFTTLLENSRYELEFVEVDIRKESVSGAENTGFRWSASFKMKLLSFVE